MERERRAIEILSVRKQREGWGIDDLEVWVVFFLLFFSPFHSELLQLEPFIRTHSSCCCKYLGRKKTKCF